MRAVLLALLAMPSLALAQDLTKSLDGDFCFASAASAVRRGDPPVLSLKPAAPEVPRAPGTMAVEVAMTEAGEALVALAECSPGEGRLDCRMEGDAGAFAITADGSAMVVWSAPGGLAFEGESGFVAWGEEGGRSATLAACAASPAMVARHPMGGR